MTILYNGTNQTLEAPCTIHEIIEKEGKSNMPMMVKLNGKFVVKKDRQNVLLNEGDSLNVLLFMGGG